MKLLFAANGGLYCRTQHIEDDDTLESFALSGFELDTAPFRCFIYTTAPGSNEFYFDGLL